MKIHARRPGSRIKLFADLFTFPTRHGLVCALLLLVFTLGRPAARAGLYHPAEPPVGPEVSAQGARPLGVSQFRDVLAEMNGLSAPTSMSRTRKLFIMKRDELLARNRSGRLSTEDKVNLGAYLIRLGQYDEAIELLTPVAAQERGHFMVLANLATANQLAGHLDRALGYLEQVRDAWPREWPGWRRHQLEFYHRAEALHLRLVRQRYRALLRSTAAKAKPEMALDDLFGTGEGKFNFVAESGKYEAGKLADRERKKLPSDAVALIQQLILWLPGPGLEDSRLYWQLGELHNASADIAAAAAVFQRLIEVHRLDSKEFREHRQLVQAALPEPVVIDTRPAADSPANETGSTGDNSLLSSIPSRPSLVVIGVSAGLIVVALLYLQIREIRRRLRG